MKFLNIYANCIPCRGSYRSLIADIQRENVYLIPNSLFVLIENDFKKYSLEEIKLSIDSNSITILEEFVEFLISNELGFIHNSIVTNLKGIDLSYESPEIINNCIIDITDINKIIELLIYVLLNL